MVLLVSLLLLAELTGYQIQTLGGRLTPFVSLPGTKASCRCYLYGVELC